MRYIPQVECQSEEEAMEACSAGADIVMLDNFTPELAALTAKNVKTLFPNVIIEVSGGISEGTIDQYLLPNVDVLSMGSLTQGYTCIDFSLKVCIPQAL